MALGPYRAFHKPDDDNQEVEMVSIPISYHEIEVSRGADGIRHVEIPKGYSMMPLAAEYQGNSDDGQTWKFRFILMGHTD